MMPALPHSCESQPSSRSPATQTPERPAGWDSSRRLICYFGTVPASTSPPSLKTLRSGTSGKAYSPKPLVSEPPGLGGNWPVASKIFTKKAG